MVDPVFGEHAAAQAAVGPLWVIESPENTPAIKKIWASGKPRFSDSPTCFDGDPGSSREDTVVAFIGTVHEHHPDWRTFEIVGVRPTERVIEALRECAAGSAEETTRGLISRGSFFRTLEACAATPDGTAFTTGAIQAKRSPMRIGTLKRTTTTKTAHGVVEARAR